MVMCTSDVLDAVLSDGGDDFDHGDERLVYPLIVRVLPMVLLLIRERI